jgi:twitching motility protein PilT
MNQMESPDGQAGATKDAAADPQAAYAKILDAAKAAGATDITLCNGEQPWFRTASGYQAAGDKIHNAAWMNLQANINPGKKARGVLEYGGSRWRFSSYDSLKGTIMEIRRVPQNRLDVSALGVPKAFLDIVQKECRGLVLVTGSTNSGKTTTLGAVIDMLNGSRELKIEVLEDPIEHVYANNRCFIKQLQFGDHFTNWSEAIEDALHHDPDIIVIAEMRTKAAIQAAITAAETGRLVLATLHTRTAAGAVRRLTDVMKDQPDLLGQFADSFTAVLAQTLLTADGSVRPGERVTAYELLLRTAGVVNVIREGRPENLSNELATGGASGMIAMDDALERLVKEKRLKSATAAARAVKAAEFLKRVGA